VEAGTGKAHEATDAEDRLTVAPGPSRRTIVSCHPPLSQVNNSPTLGKNYLTKPHGFRAAILRKGAKERLQRENKRGRKKHA